MLFSKKLNFSWHKQSSELSSEVVFRKHMGHLSQTEEKFKLLVAVRPLKPKNTSKREKTYTEIGGDSLSSHVGGFFWVTHHLHGVHLNKNIHNEHRHAEHA